MAARVEKGDQWEDLIGRLPLKKQKKARVRLHRALRKKSVNTRLTYEKAVGELLRFSKKTRQPVLPSTLLPLERFFVAAMDGALRTSNGSQAVRKAWSSLKGYEAAFNFVYRALRIKSPLKTRDGELMLEHFYYQLKRPQKQAPAMTAEHIDTISRVTDKCDPLAVRNFVAISVMHETAARISEMAPLKRRHLSRSKNGRYILTLRRSKSSTVRIRSFVLDATSSKWISLYLKLWTIAPDDPLFPPYRRHYSHMHPTTFGQIIKRAAIKADLPNAKRFSGHSPRVGCVQDMLVAGFEDHEIAEHADMTVIMVQRYARNLDPLRNPAFQVGYRHRRAFRKTR